MPRYQLRFYEELNDFLPPGQSRVPFFHQDSRSRPIQAVIESLGVPASEVDLILANGRSVPFSYLPREGDRISVYPMFEALDISTVTRLQSRPLRRTRFILDVHLGKLARYLRMMGLDSLYRNNYSDDEIVRIMQRERRIILTRDRGLLGRKTVTHGYFLRSTHPRRQAVEVLRRFDLMNGLQPFTLCIECNTSLGPVHPDRIDHLLPPAVLQTFQEYYHCIDCGRVYWEGSHAQRMKQLVRELQWHAAFEME
ncbi:MAG: Mut7-C ubiquitin/RNAse domain-containing protein [Nitrospinaceae bacterium]|nr:Mut7-C ubiquitin/RNAse domain-containing protein [Nitrospinaceae bacterium]